MRQTAVNTFTGGVDHDSDLRAVAQGDWIASKDVINYHLGQDGVVVPMMGMREVNLGNVTLPNGINQCVGSYEDRQSKSVVWFNYNSNNQHGIYRYWYETERVDRVILYPPFNFQPNRKITAIAVIDGRYLIWSDALAKDYDLGGMPLPTNVGMQPRCVDMELATIFGDTILAANGFSPYKSLEYEIFLHFNVMTIAALVDDILIQVKTTNIDGTADIIPWTTIATISQQSDPDYANTKAEIYNQIALAIQALGLGAEDRRRYASVTVPPGPNGQRLQLQIIEAGNPSTKVLGYARPVNHYYFPFVDEQFDYSRPMPLDHIDAAYVKNFLEYDVNDEPIITRTNENYGANPQFTYRYVFYDGGRSAWAPYSVVPTNFESNIEDLNPFEIQAKRIFTDILLRLQDEKLVQPWVGFIRKIEIAYRHSNDKPIVSIGQFHPWELNETASFGPSEYVNGGWQKLFSGNETAVPVPSDEVGSQGSQQVLKLFDWVPKRVNGLAPVTDETGTSRIVVGGEAMGYENPDVRATIEVINAFIPTTFNFINEQRSRKFLKKGGRYAVCIFYYDKKGFTPGAVKIGEVKIPYQGQAQNVHYLRVNFDTSPPAWAVRWRIGISRNLNQGVYYQQPAGWGGAIVVNDDAEYTLATFDQATHLRLRLGVNDQDPTNYQLSLFEWGQNVQGTIQWAAEPRDRVQVVYGIGFVYSPNPGGNYGEPRNIPYTQSLDSPGFNAPIAGFMQESTGTFTARYLLVEKREEYREWFTFNLAGNNLGLAPMVEIYRPSVQSEEFYYETPAAGRVHLDGNVRVHQPAGDPQRVNVLVGDTYYLSPRYYRTPDTYYSNLYIENPTQYKWNNDVNDDFGRPGVRDDGKDEYNYQRIRISDAYTPATRINGIFSYRGLNFIDVDKQFGPIMAMVPIAGNVDAICWNKIQPIYIGKGRVLQLDGAEQVGRSSEIMSLANPLQQDWGTQNPESLAWDGSRIWGVDRRNCLVWRRAYDGLNAISYYKNLNYFKKIFADTESTLTAGLYILGAWNPRLNMYFFTITAHTLYADTRDPVQVAGRTWGFMESDNRWKDEFRFIPEMYGLGGIHMIAFRIGVPWRFDPAAPPARYFQSQFTPEITFVANELPATTKLWQSIRIQSKGLWTAPEIRIPANEPYGAGMLSRLKAGNIRNEEGMFVADFLRDMNDPEFVDITDLAQRQANALLRGRPLRGEVIVVTLHGQPGEDLARVDTDFIPSMNTK